MVAEKLKASGGEAAIVLISDGKETCEADPCQLVAMLKKAGIKFTLHVIGFDVGGIPKNSFSAWPGPAAGNIFQPKTPAILERPPRKP